jgi:hypothetical protein
MTTFQQAETTAMVEELVGRAHLAMINTLNGAAEKIYAESQKVVPKSKDHHTRQAHASYPAEPLASRGFVSRATVESPVAQIGYDSPYAAAQEVGRMVYESRGGKPVDWQAKHYSTPGTRSRYLEDSAKMVLAEIPEELAIQGRIAVGDLPGLITPHSELQEMGHVAGQQPLPSGEIEQAMSQEQVKATQVAYLQKPPAGESLFKE